MVKSVWERPPPGGSPNTDFTGLVRVLRTLTLLRSVGRCGELNSPSQGELLSVGLIIKVSSESDRLLSKLHERMSTETAIELVREHEDGIGDNGVLSPGGSGNDGDSDGATFLFARAWGSLVLDSRTMLHFYSGKSDISHRKSILDDQISYAKMLSAQN